MSLAPKERVPLAPRTTLEVGGPARYWLDAPDTGTVVQALGWARQRDIAVQVLGAGSNVVISDRGLDALVLRVRKSELVVRRDGPSLFVRAGAGVVWDDLVRRAVEQGGGGVECLSGIPGDVGAAPIQNVGAYGQEVAQTIETVHLVERSTGKETSLPRDECGFGYRHSLFKAEAQHRYVIVGVDFRLPRGRAPTVDYPDLRRAVEQSGETPTLTHVREAVLRLRRCKSMLVDRSDENRRSVGSFFVNPTLTRAELAEVERRAARRLAAGQSVPQHPAADGLTKVPAAWLIEHAGMPRGTVRGRVGLSTRHTLAIVNRGGATAADIVGFAGEIRARVRDCFGVALTPEPQLLGFEPAELAALVD